MSLSDITKSLKNNYVQCGTPPSKETNPYHCDLSKEHCLFNILHDPCEFYDVSEKYPHKLKQMKDVALQYQQRMVSSLYEPTDPNCNPMYYNDTWISWNDVQRNALKSVILEMTKEII